MKFLTNLFSAFGKTKKNKRNGKSRRGKKTRRNMHRMRGG
jgi:hypothetical protein